jgi:hypothetical protein
MEPKEQRRLICFDFRNSLTPNAAFGETRTDCRFDHRSLVDFLAPEAHGASSP